MEGELTMIATANEISQAVMQEANKQIENIKKEYETKLYEVIMEQVREQYQGRIDFLERECKERQRWLDALEESVRDLSGRRYD